VFTFIYLYRFLPDPKQFFVEKLVFCVHFCEHFNGQEKQEPECIAVASKKE
jgi:hypothetical protein